MMSKSETAKTIRESNLSKKEAIQLISLIMMNYDIVASDLGLPLQELRHAVEDKEHTMRLKGIEI